MMDLMVESMMEGFFESFVHKIQDYVVSIEDKVTGLGTTIGKSAAAAIVSFLWDDTKGRIILLILGLHAMYVVRVFVADMILLSALAKEYWRVSMFVGVTLVILHLVTLKGEGVEYCEEELPKEIDSGLVEVGVGNPGDRPRATSFSYWWTSSVRKSDGKVQTTTEETTTFKITGTEKGTEVDFHQTSSKKPFAKSKPTGKLEGEEQALLNELNSLKPKKLVVANETSTVQISPDRQSTFAAGINPSELEEGLQVRSDLPFPADKPIYFEVRVGIKDPKGWIGIGLCTSTSPSTGMPGWFEGSYAYHGDDGTLYLQNQEGKPYGPTYGMFDVIGCGVDYEKDEIFFTKNGKYIGKASKAPKGELYAVIGLGYKGARIAVNFGDVHFHYEAIKA